MADQDFIVEEMAIQHRDGLMIRCAEKISTSLAQRRTTTGNCYSHWTVILGTAWVPSPYQGHNKLEMPRAILAFPDDVHHCVLDADECDHLAERLQRYARHLRSESRSREAP